LTDPDTVSQKVSFILGLPEFQWLVGAGVYLDDVETHIALMQEQLNNQVKIKVIYSALIVIAIIVLFFMLFSRLKIRLKNDIELFLSFFKKAADADEEINQDEIKFAELGQMAGYANKMIADRSLATDALRESEQRWQFALEGAGDGVWDWNAKTNQVYFSRRCKEMLGFAENEIVGSLYELNKRIHPEDRKLVNAEINKHLTGETPVHVSEYRIQCKDGNYKWILDRGKVVTRDQDGHPLRVIGTYTDITQRKQAEEDRIKLEDQLRQAHKMEAVGTLAGGIAHDFNNILAAITGYTELACDAVSEGKDNTKFLENVLKSSERAKVLVQQILAFSRRAETDMKPMDLNHEVFATAQLIERMIPKMISIELHLDKDLRLIKGDPNQIEQALLNLAGNAKDAMPNGGKLIIETRNVTLDQEYTNGRLGLLPGEYVQLTVSDTGHGIDKDTLDHIFDPFYTTKELGKGTGLGLASVYGIVKSHGGEITCYSEPGSGAAFKVYLPVFQQEVRDSLEAPRQPQQLQGGTETLLLVDDEDSLRDLGSQTLSMAGYSVITAQSGEEALEVYHSRAADIDLVIMDLGMPGMGGQKALKAILEVDPRAKVMIASGYAVNGSVKKAMQDGAAGYVAKPFLRAELLTMVRSVLDKK
jgi:PAS domain S-box-containing protein